MEAVEIEAMQMKTQLEQRDVKLEERDELVTEAEQAGAGPKVDHHRGIDHLKARWQLTQSTLDELSAASAWNDLEIALEKLMN